MMESVGQAASASSTASRRPSSGSATYSSRSGATRLNTSGQAIMHWPWWSQVCVSTVTLMIPPNGLSKKSTTAERERQLDGAGDAAGRAKRGRLLQARLWQAPGEQRQRLTHVDPGQPVPRAVVRAAAAAE